MSAGRAALVLVVVLLTSGRAWAQDESEEARARFQHGTELFDEGNLEGALVEFEASFALRPVPVVLFNIAQTHKLLFNYREAIAAYRRYLTLGGEELAGARVAEVRTTIARLERSMGRLAIECVPPGARVEIDGRAAGVAPLPELALAAGTRHVEVTVEGRVPIARDVELSAGSLARVCMRGAPAAESVDPRAAAAPAQRGGSIFGRWWFWTAAVVVVAAGVAGAVILTSPDEATPVGGNVDPDVIGAAHGPFAR